MATHTYYPVAFFFFAMSVALLLAHDNWLLSAFAALGSRLVQLNDVENTLCNCSKLIRYSIKLNIVHEKRIVCDIGYIICLARHACCSSFVIGIWNKGG